MVDISRGWQRTQISLSFSEVREHVLPCAIKCGRSIPETKILLQDWLAREDDVSKVDMLPCSHRGFRLLRQIGQVVDGVENGVNRLGDVVVHV